MTHDEYMEGVRVRVLDLARRMLEEDEALIERSRELNDLLHQLHLEGREGRQHPPLPDDLAIFAVVDSEAHVLPIGVAPELLDESYRDRVEDEKRKMTEFYRDAVRLGCQAVLRRYSDT
jgi:hypothetical protein